MPACESQFTSVLGDDATVVKVPTRQYSYEAREIDMGACGSELDPESSNLAIVDEGDEEWSPCQRACCNRHTVTPCAP